MASPSEIPVVDDVNMAEAAAENDDRSSAGRTARAEIHETP
jgi:hypothetical protein